MQQTSLRTITHVAVLYNGAVHSLLSPARHPDIIRSLNGCYGPTKYGFLDSDGKFVDRYEAMDVAIAAGQLKSNLGVQHFEGRQLFSEDVW